MLNTSSKGQITENWALAYLEQQGLTLLERNFRFHHLEIDLIMQDGQHIIFIEVRYRRDKNYGGSLASINASKRKNIRTTANYYLVSTKQYNKKPCRFDVLAIDGVGKNKTFEWIKNAFY